MCLLGGHEREIEMSDPNKHMSAKGAYDCLTKARHAMERGWKAELNAMHHGDSITGNRRREQAERWFVKMEENFAKVEEFIVGVEGSLG